MMRIGKTKTIWNMAMLVLLISIALSFIIPDLAQAYDLDSAVSCPSGACLSETANSNTAASPNGWPSGTYPNQVEPISRETLAGIQRFWNRINGNITVGGTANAITLATSNGSFPATYVTGEQLCFKALYANTAATTVALNSLGTVNLYKQTTSGPAPLGGGEIQASQLLCIAYDGTEYQILGGVPNASTGTVNSGTANQLAYYGSTGTAVSGTNALPSGTTATTQSTGDTSTDVANDAFASNASNLQSGTVATARLGSGSASSTTFLRGDQTWATVSGPTCSFGTTGYCEWPGGPVDQWVHLSGASNPQTVSFSTAFPNACLAVQCTLDTSAHGGAWFVVYATCNTSSVTVGWGGGSDVTTCRAIGN